MLRIGCRVCSSLFPSPFSLRSVDAVVMLQFNAMKTCLSIYMQLLRLMNAVMSVRRLTFSYHTVYLVSLAQSLARHRKLGAVTGQASCGSLGIKRPTMHVSREDAASAVAICRCDGVSADQRVVQVARATSHIVPL
jgi:hypothetical protein